MSESPSQSHETEKSYAGHAPPVATAEQRRQAVEIAFDYRGDVTIDLHDGRSIEGYVYDRQERPQQGLVVRIMPKDGSDRLTFPADQIARLVCSDKDPAAGRSFETWVKKYAQKKMRGEKANFEPEERD